MFDEPTLIHNHNHNRRVRATTARLDRLDTMGPTKMDAGLVRRHDSEPRDFRTRTLAGSLRTLRTLRTLRVQALARKRRALLQPKRQLLLRHGPREVKALHRRAAMFGKKSPLPLGLHSFGNNIQVQTGA